MNRDMKHHIAFNALLFSVMVFLSSCSGSSDSASDNASDTGSIAFSLEISSGELVRAEAAGPPIDCEASGVVTVQAEVLDENGVLIMSGPTWPCDVREGTIESVPRGVNRTVRLWCRNANGAITYWGERSGVTVYGGRTNDIGTIPLNGPIPPEENQNPVASDDQAVVSWGRSVDVLSTGDTSVLWNDFDPEGQTLTADTTPVIAPRYGTLTLNEDGTFRYTHDGRSASETDSFTYSISDGNGGTATAVVTITIADQYFVAPAPAGSDENDGSSSSPFATIGHAIDVARGTEERPVIIHIAGGTYLENISLDAWEFIEGGWKSDFTRRWDFAHEGLLPTESYQTIIDGGNAGRCITVDTDTTSIDGITVRGGTPSSADTGGGGIAVITCSPSIRNCRIENNSTLAAASSTGGGMYIRLGSPRITNCVFSGNLSTGAENNYGGALYISQSYPVITDCVFTANHAGCSTGAGGAIFSYQSGPVIQRCVFDGNSAGGDYALGGAICNDAGSPVITDCIFTNNAASGTSWGKGGAVFNQSGSPVITNCTFTSNTASSPSGYAKGGAIYNDSSATSSITNCILWGDSAPYYSEIYCGSECTLTYSDIGQSGFENDADRHNISLDPRFADQSSGDLHLQDGSPCIDAGSSSAPSLPETDFDGMPRIVGRAADMGAFEYQQQDQ
ncbi:MAG TPA: Ig-like domain-containing protein [Deltaproteobacteria bacterium]|nr:Ig-like domain-containing protein [Deltaproteobacteria bacterium]HQI00541.1 Ig-like domain-containing protein [Deltaproteobacteria bacterium]HQJ08332.1 Ig-like domain-containing protein [Deltaproteobacteria bacterium]